MQITEAETLSKELLKLDPGDPRNLVLSGRMFIMENKYQQALTVLQAALQADSQSAAGYYFLGVAQNALGFRSPAKTSWTHALELHPQMIDAQLALAELEWNGTTETTRNPCG
jgi:cytochrome c-type biogenesis protein CcmH/NrfG